MTKFLALYAGRTVGEAKLIAISANAELVTLVANRLIDQHTPQSQKDNFNSNIDNARQDGKRDLDTSSSSPCGSVATIDNRSPKTNEDET